MGINIESDSEERPGVEPGSVSKDGDLRPCFETHAVRAPQHEAE